MLLNIVFAGIGLLVIIYTIKYLTQPQLKCPFMSRIPSDYYVITTSKEISPENVIQQLEKLNIMARDYIDHKKYRVYPVAASKDDIDKAKNLKFVIKINKEASLFLCS